MKLGIVLPIAYGNHVISEKGEFIPPTWDFLSSYAVRAEELGFEYAFTHVTLRGHGGKTNHWDYPGDSLTTMTGLGVVTKKMRLMGSVAIPTMNPGMAAKLVAGVAEVTGDRFDLNLVTGWNKLQYDQMGLWPGDEYFSTRYDVAEEYVTILRELWETGKSNFKGKYYTMNDCRLGLKPDAPIGLACGGQSDRGLDFVARRGDHAYVLGTGDGVEGVRNTLDRLDDACDAAGRKVDAFHVLLVILDETDERAQAKVENYIEHADHEAIANIQAAAGLDAGGGTAGRLTDVRGATFQNVDRIVGSPETVARYLDELAELDNLTGTFLAFDEAERGLEMFAEKVQPLMKSRAKEAVKA
jgi:pyrimidine oxygenase